MHAVVVVSAAAEYTGSRMGRENLQESVNDSESKTQKQRQTGAQPVTANAENEHTPPSLAGGALAPGNSLSSSLRNSANRSNDLDSLIKSISLAIAFLGAVGECCSVDMPPSKFGCVKRACKNGF